MMTQQEYLDCDSAYGWQLVECGSCEYVWRDLYTLTGFEGAE